MRILKFFSITAFLTLFLAGCVQSMNGYVDQNNTHKVSDNKPNSFVFIDHNLNSTEIHQSLLGDKTVNSVMVTIDRSGVSSTDVGNMKVWAVLRNRTDYDLVLEGKAMFFDRAFTPINDESAWKRIFIPANGTASYDETSLNNLADKFLIEFRESR